MKWYKIAMVVSIIILIYSIIVVNHEEKYCGVIQKIEDESVNSTGGKHSRIYTERYVLIKFEGFTKAVNLEPTSYYSSYKGKNVCVSISDLDMEKAPRFICSILLLSIVVVVVSFVIWLIKYLDA